MRASNPPTGQDSGHPAIEPFVRTTLGCQCPDEVFKSVVIERVGAEDGGIAHVRLTVGNRLLIYVFEPGEADAAAEVVERLVGAGLAERNARGLNRFRLVIAPAHAQELSDDASAAFARVARSDERTHLHLIRARDLPPALRSR